MRGELTVHVLVREPIGKPRSCLGDRHCEHPIAGHRLAPHDEHGILGAQADLSIGTDALAAVHLQLHERSQALGGGRAGSSVAYVATARSPWSQPLQRGVEHRRTAPTDEDPVRIG